MKEVILSADGDSIVYSVPDEVANDLRNYCSWTDLGRNLPPAYKNHPYFNF